MFKEDIRGDKSMKKIAFFVQHMLCGGVENSLIALTKKLLEMGKEITIYVVLEDGEFMDKIPDGVKIKKIPLPKKIEKILPIGGTKLTVRKNIESHHYARVITNLKNHFIGNSGYAELNVDFEKIPELKDKYDIAVNFHMHSPFLVRYLSEKVNADRKFTWIHNDFSTTGYHIRPLKTYLDCCEKFFGVSQQVVNEFQAIFPEYKNKTSLALNIVPIEEIKKKAETGTASEYKNTPYGYLKLLSVGRLEEQKGYDITIQVCKQLVDSGCKFQWFILGEGSERKRLEKEIRKNGLENTLFLLGIRRNPYPYFKDCDIYVQTSRHEGYVTTVTEAKIFARPIVVTDVSGAKEQLRDNVNGYISEISVEGVFKKLHLLILDKKKRTIYMDALKSESSEIRYEWISNFD